MKTVEDVGMATVRAGNGTGEVRARPWLARRWRHLLAAATGPLSVVIFLAIWQLVGSHLNPILLSTPSAVATAFAHMVTGKSILGSAFLRAMEDLLAGYLLAVLVGLVVGVLAGRHRTVERVINPYVNFFQATPLIALTPLVVIWFGIGYTAEISITFLLAVWTIIINTQEGVKATPPILLDMARVYHASERRVVREIALPNAVPYIFAGLRIGLAKGVVGMIIAGMDITLKGLGGLIATYGYAFKTSYLLVTVICSSIVGVILTVVIEVIRRTVFPWSMGVAVKSKR
ncbi:MAG: ABC transporter permease [Acidimicrobiales bacterium]